MLQAKRRKWEYGIPEYKKTDLLSERAILKLAMKAVKQYEFDARDYKILFMSLSSGKVPNFVCQKDGKRICVWVKSNIAPLFPEMSEAEKERAIAYSKRKNAKCYFAPIVVGSYDDERFEASLALKDDELCFSYPGLQEIKLTYTSEWIRETLESINALDPSLKPKEEPNTNVSFSLRIPELDSDGSDSLRDTESYTTWEKELKTETFQEALMRLISEKRMKYPEFYKAALLDRKLFSAIKNNPDYQPKKETAVACCLGLRLDWKDAEELLGLAGFTLSLSISWDRVIYYCLNKGINDIDAVNMLLYENGDKCIRVS